jgi:hypothetical protein
MITSEDEARQANLETWRRLRVMLGTRRFDTFAVTGSRGWFDWRTMWGALALIPLDAVMFNGMAGGADTLAYSFWWSQGGEVRPFHANWKIGNSAGFLRNELMMEHMPGFVLEFLRHDLPSNGTRHAQAQAEGRGIPVFGFHQVVTGERSRATDPRSPHRTDRDRVSRHV